MLVYSFFEFLPTCPTKKLCVHNIVLKSNVTLRFAVSEGKRENNLKRLFVFKL